MWHEVEVPKTPPSTPPTAAATGKGKGKAKAKVKTPTPSPSNPGDDSDAATKKKKKDTKRVWRYCRAHVLETKVFIKALRNRLTKVNQTHYDRPLEFPIVEVGYAKNSIERLSAHKGHHNSNYIMKLMEAIFWKFFPHVKGDKGKLEPEFFIDQEVIALIWKVDQAEIAEIGLTRLAEGYIHNGGGFSHYPAGLSNASAHKVAPKIWSAAQIWMMEKSCFKANHEAELQILRDQVDKKRVANEGLEVQIQQREDEQIPVRAINAVVKELAKTSTVSSSSDLAPQMQDPLRALEARVNMLELQRRKPEQDIKEPLEKLADAGRKLPSLTELNLHPDEFMTTQHGEEATSEEADSGDADDEDEGEDADGDMEMVDDDGGEGSAEQMERVELVAESQGSEMALDVDDEQAMGADIDQVLAKFPRKFKLSFQGSALDKSHRSAPPRFDKPDVPTLAKEQS